MIDTGLAAYLGQRYGIRVTGLIELDRDVYRVERADGPAWVARAFGPERPAAQVDGDDGADLPHAFVHPDFVPANAIATPDGGLVIVDWTGAGRGPRIWPLAFLLWAAARVHPRLVGLAFSYYRKHVELEPAELARLGDVRRGCRTVGLPCPTCQPPAVP
ncbi:MAG TPA: phosphotransferase [Pseudonocardiaceae bacterium]|nr:phosphotransferase [Pseudonocardiaceae bacterium]